MDGPDVGNEGTISSLLLVAAILFIKVLKRIWQVWLKWQVMVHFIVQAYRMNGGARETISSVMQVFLAIVQFLVTVLQAWLSGLAIVNYIVHAYRFVICFGCKIACEAVDVQPFKSRKFTPP